MSKRRSAGDIVWKVENAGFVGEASLCQIQTDDEPMPCILDCGDPECREWATLLQCDKDGHYLGGMACHVSECEMMDTEGKGSGK